MFRRAANLVPDGRLPVGTGTASFRLLRYLARERTPLWGKDPRTAADRTTTLLRRLCFDKEKAVCGLGETHVLQQLRDIYLNIDRCLDIDDLRGFSRASHQLRELLSRLRDHID